MVYTHYWTQTRAFTAEEWTETTEAIREIVSYTENMLAAPLGNGTGDPGTRPVFGAGEILFNGVGADSYETFAFSRKVLKGAVGDGTCYDSHGFCKTARKPYDVAVTATLCYLASVTGTHSVSSDGRGVDFVAGLNAARQAVPAKANMLDIPIDIMREDRWTGPWVRTGEKCHYHARFCVDGFGYVSHRDKTWYRFPSHQALAEFLDRNKRATFKTGSRTSLGIYGREEPDIWKASGSFDAARHARIAKAQTKVLKTLFPVGAAHAHNPPAYIRPGEMPRPEDAGTFCYSLSELLQKVAA